MSCGKYSGWMTDAALGELRAEREPELLAHAMECDACREALDHARNVRALVERGVESLVAGEPTPGFEMRLRRRLALETRPVQSYWKTRVPLAATALAVVAAFLIFITTRVASRDAGNTGVVSTASTTAPAVASPGLPVEPSALASGAGATNEVRASQRALHARSASPGALKIIVPKGQLVAAARLSEAINSGRVDGTQLLEAQKDYHQPLDVKPIEIAPLESLAPNAEPETSVAPLQF